MKRILKYSRNKISRPGQFLAMLISVPKRERSWNLFPLKVSFRGRPTPPPASQCPPPRYIITYLNKSCLDVLVVQELGKDEEFLAQKLISKIHGCVHNPWAVRANGVGNMTDIYSVQMFVIWCELDKNLKQKTTKVSGIIPKHWLLTRTAQKYISNLVVEVVKISRNEHVNVSHDFQHVQTLRKRWWDKGISTKWLDKTLKLECTDEWMDYW